MNYGTSAYGATAVGGNVPSQFATFFSYVGRVAGDYEAQLELNTDEEWYSVFIQQSSEPGLGGGAPESFMETRIYISNDPGETPQQQVAIGDALYVQAVVAAARFITVRVTVINDQIFSITGRPGD